MKYRELDISLISHMLTLQFPILFIIISATCMRYLRRKCILEPLANPRAAGLRTVTHQVGYVAVLTVGLRSGEIASRTPVQVPDRALTR